MYRNILSADIHDEMDKILSHVPLEKTIDKEQLIHLLKTMENGVIEQTKIKKGMEINISDLEQSCNLTVHIEISRDIV